MLYLPSTDQKGFGFPLAEADVYIDSCSCRMFMSLCTPSIAGSLSLALSIQDLVFVLCLFLHSLTLDWLCDLLWSTEQGRRNLVPALSLGLRKPCL